MAHDADLVADLETPLPATVPAGTAMSLFCYGSYAHPWSVRRVELTVDGRCHKPSAQGMSRPDLETGRQGFWAVLPIEPDGRAAALEVGLRAELAGGGNAVVQLGEIAVSSSSGPDGDVGSPGDEPPIAVCMATFDPDETLLRRQLDSLRAQSHENWTCVISDDCSRPERYEAIERAIAGDPRFEISRSDQRLGFYRNFERALGMVPPGSELIGLCDQDDRWDPDKLAMLREAIGDAELAYCDARLVDQEGRLLARTMWEGRRNNHDDLASLLIANTITGAASLFRRRVLERALPFPEAPGWQFHDHWLGLVALASGRIAYVDRPLYDYTQHRGAVLRGLIATGPEPEPRKDPRLASRAGLRSALERWRARYFYGYVPARLRAQVLRARCGATVTASKRRALGRMSHAEDGLRGLAWLLARRLRLLTGRTETNGAETLLVTGIAWRWAAGLCARVRRRRRAGCSAALPAFDPSVLETRRWRRRQTR